MRENFSNNNDSTLRDSLRSGQPILLRGGIIISMDAKIGVIERGDVLVRGQHIEAISSQLIAPDDVLIVDVTGKLVLPGLIDAHRHTWETVLRGIGGDWSLLDYFHWMVQVCGTYFRPEDIYAANMLAAIESLEGGTTTIGDWADAGRTPEHVEAATKALENSGIRGRYHYANVYGPAQDWGTTEHVAAMWDRYGSAEGRISMQMGIDSTRDPAFPEAAAWRFAQERGIAVATHAGGFGWDNDEWIGRLHRHGFMKPDVTYIHVVAVPEKYMQLISDTGGTVTVATCSNCNSGQGFPRFRPLCEHHIPVALGSDTDMRWNQTIFENMRSALSADRAYQHMLAHREGHLQAYNQLRSEQVLNFATIGGARALGLSEQVGTLTPGKRADIVVMRADERSMSPLLNPLSHTVFQGDQSLVETVMVDGRVIKYQGELLDHDRQKITDLATRSRDYLIEKIGEERIRYMMAHYFVDPITEPPKTL